MEAVAHPAKECIQIFDNNNPPVAGVDYIPALNAGLLVTINTKQNAYTGSATYCNWADGKYVHARKGYDKVRIAEAPLIVDGKYVINNNIFSQGQCGDCWSVSTAMAFSDRLGIAKNAKFVDTCKLCLAVCINTGDSYCAGGYPSDAAKYLVSTGIPQDGCIDYALCATGNCKDDLVCPTNGKQCPSIKEAAIIYKGDNCYALPDPDSLKHEIEARGPVVCAFAVYAGFENLSSDSWSNGIYMRSSNSADYGSSPLGGHAVACVGWGTDAITDTTSGKPMKIFYWIVRNSWGPRWNTANYVVNPQGEKVPLPGFFKIAFSTTVLSDGSQINQDVGFDNQTSSTEGPVGGGFAVVVPTSVTPNNNPKNIVTTTDGKNVVLIIVGIIIIILLLLILRKLSTR